MIVFILSSCLQFLKVFCRIISKNCKVTSTAVNFSPSYEELDIWILLLLGLIKFAIEFHCFNLPKHHFKLVFKWAKINLYPNTTQCFCSSLFSTSYPTDLARMILLIQIFKKKISFCFLKMFRASVVHCY